MGCSLLVEMACNIYYCHTSLESSIFIITLKGFASLLSIYIWSWLPRFGWHFVWGTIFYFLWVHVLPEYKKMLGFFLTILKVDIVFTKNIWKEDRSNREVTAVKKLVPSNRKVMYQGNTYIVLNECGMLDEKHSGRDECTHSKEGRCQLETQMTHSIIQSNDSLVKLHKRVPLKGKNIPNTKKV